MPVGLIKGFSLQFLWQVSVPELERRTAVRVAGGTASSVSMHAASKLTLTDKLHEPVGESSILASL